MTDIHIEILNFGRDNPGFSETDLKSKFPDDFDWIIREIHKGNLFQHDGRFYYYLSFDDRFRLLEHSELQEARKSSKNAMCIAIISIFLNIVAIGFQIYQNFLQS